MINALSNVLKLNSAAQHGERSDHAGHHQPSKPFATVGERDARKLFEKKASFFLKKKMPRKFRKGTRHAPPDDRRLQGVRKNMEIVEERMGVA